jgi:two-component SAPR family response regulator
LSYLRHCWLVGLTSLSGACGRIRNDKVRISRDTAIKSLWLIAKAKELIAYGQRAKSLWLMADSIWQEKNERSVVSSGYTPSAISYQLFKVL